MEVAEPMRLSILLISIETTTVHSGRRRTGVGAILEDSHGHRTDLEEVASHGRHELDRDGRMGNGLSRHSKGKQLRRTRKGLLENDVQVDDRVTYQYIGRWNSSEPQAAG